jgi:hypothetical protein
MSLKKRLQEDWKNALKSKDKFKANTISMARAAVLLVEKTNGKELDDEKVTDILAKEVKQRREAIQEFKNGNRQDLVDSTENEIKILLNYLPQQLSKEDITEIVHQAVNEVGANSMKDMGKIMSYIMPKVKGRADGKLISEIVKQHLNM